MNKVNLIGRNVIDPKLSFTPTEGKAVVKLRLAVPRQGKKDEADFIQCVAFGKTAEIIGQYFAKGERIGITGNIRTGSYDAKDGTKRYTTDVYIESFYFIEQKGGTASENGYSNSSFEADMTPVDDGEMPF